MELNAKIVLIVNSPMGSRITAGPGREGYEVAKDLLKNNLLGKVYCFGIEGNCDLPADKVEAYCTSEIKRQWLGWISRMHRRYPIIRGRRRIEQWMDRYFAKQLMKSDGEVMYCPKPIFPSTVKRAKSLGLQVILETSVLHPRFNLDVVSAEKKRLNISGAAGYTDEVRVRNIEKALKHCDKIFAWSRFLRDSYIKYGVAESKFIGGMEFSPPGIDVEKFCPDISQKPSKFTVLHVSSITIIKGVQYLLDAWEQVADRIDGELILVGPADRDMTQLITKRKIKNCNWVGHVNNPVDYFRRASVFVSPSLSDAGPRTVLESMACGVPSIVSDYCGVSRMLTHGKDGLVYTYNDVDDLVKQIEWAYHNRQALDEMGRQAYEMVKDFSVNNYSAEIEQRLAIVAKVVN